MQEIPSESRPRVSFLRWLFLVVVLPFVTFLPLGAASAAPAYTTLASYTFDTSASGWSHATWVSGSACNGGGGGCIQNQGSGSSMNSPLITVTTGQQVNVTYYLSGNGGSVSQPPLQLLDQTGTSVYTDTASSCTAASGVWVSCSLAGSYTVPSGVTGITLYFGGTSNELVDSVTVTNGAPPTYSGGGATGSLSFPLLDLASISSNVGLFFSFMSPLLWILLGIGVAGIILARARNFV